MTHALEDNIRAADEAHTRAPTTQTAWTLVEAYGALVGWLEARGLRPTYAERLKRRAQNTAQWAQAQGEMG